MDIYLVIELLSQRSVNDMESPRKRKLAWHRPQIVVMARTPAGNSVLVSCKFHSSVVVDEAAQNGACLIADHDCEYACYRIESS